jgi:DNA-binding MarR family transcriptional regulator
MQFDLQKFLPYRLSLLTNTVSQGIAALYRDRYAISIVEWRIVAVLGRFPGLTASEVVERTAMDKVAVHRAVKTLMARRLLQRDTDPDDRRRQRLCLTPAQGQTLLSEVVPQALGYESRLLEALDATERETLELILEKLQRQANQLLAAE